MDPKLNMVPSSLNPSSFDGVGLTPAQDADPDILVNRTEVHKIKVFFSAVEVRNMHKRALTAALKSEYRAQMSPPKSA